MKSRETYENWDFDNIWTIDEDYGYPSLKNVPMDMSASIHKPLFTAGVGSEQDPYIISTEEQF